MHEADCPEKWNKYIYIHVSVISFSVKNCFTFYLQLYLIYNQQSVIGLYARPSNGFQFKLTIRFIDIGIYFQLFRNEIQQARAL